jgi:crotonobetainyl-CoA:carnitine CoA-transferase CaiB-like acyl-CoA transferase
MGQPELARDPRFVTGIERANNADACEAHVSDWFASVDFDAAATALSEAGVPAAPVYTVEDIFKDEQYQHRQMLLDLEDPDLGTLTVTGVVPKLSKTPGNVRWSGRKIGADTVAVLKEELELSDRDLSELASTGVIAGQGLTS